MLTKKDLKDIGELINNKLVEFFDQVLLPYFDKHVEKKLVEHDRRFDEMDNHFDRIERKLEKYDYRFDKDEGILDHHEKRILHLEKHPSYA